MPHSRGGSRKVARKDLSTYTALYSFEHPLARKFEQPALKLACKGNLMAIRMQKSRTTNTIQTPTLRCSGRWPRPNCMPLADIHQFCRPMHHQHEESSPCPYPVLALAVGKCQGTQPRRSLCHR